MNTISRNKILLSIIGILLVSNIAVVAIFVSHHCQEDPKKPGFTERLKKEADNQIYRAANACL